MLTPDQITLHDLIIHKIDHLYGLKPRCSDLTAEISEEVDIYLRDHIFRNREHKFSRSGVFTTVPVENTNLQQLCDELLKPKGEFIPQSQEIANHLFTSIKGDKRIHPGDLVVCTFSEGNGDRWLALLKMDPQDSFVTVEQRVDGKRRYVLKRVRDVMPVGELQKCAFILPESLRTKRQDLIVLDQQQARYGASRLVASFFSKAFLQCKVGLNERELTQMFLGASTDWIDSKKGIWSDEAIDEFKEDLGSQPLKRSINILSFAHAAIEEPDEQDDYVEKVAASLRAEKLQDMVFKPDPSVMKRPQILQIEGDNNLRIRVNSDAVGQDKTLYYEKDEATNTWAITIKTTNLTTVYKQ